VDPAVELFSEGLEVDIGCIDVAKEFRARLGADVPGRDRDGLDTGARQAAAASTAYSRKITGSL